MRSSDFQLGQGRRLWSVAMAFVLAVHLCAGAAQAEGITRRVKITTSGTALFSRSVLRGDRDTYVVQVAGAKTMKVSISSKEKNAVFEVNGQDGKPLPCNKGKECRQWSKDVSAGGEFRVVVGGTRGNASYKLRIVVR